MTNRRRVPALAAACALLVALMLLLPATEATSVFVKLHPGKELCLGHYVVRDPEGDTVKVSFTHRALSPRLMDIRFGVYGPSTDLETRGKPIDTGADTIDSLADITSLYFDAEETGVYTVCLRTRRRAPTIGMEVYFSTDNEEIDPPTIDDDAVALDKPLEIADYADRLKMLRLTVETSRDEVRMAQMRRVMFDHTSKSITNVTIGFSLLNMVLAVLLSWWSERYLERYYLKAKIA